MLFIVRFSTTSDLISWAIRKRTDFFVSHVEFQVLRDYRDCRGLLHKAGSTLGARFPDGVKWREPKENIGQKNVFAMVRPGVDQAAAWVDRNRVGWPYDLFDIFGIASGEQDWHDQKHRICSETVTEGFENTSEKFFGDYTKIWQITPRDVFLVRGWSVLYSPEFLKKVRAI